MQKYPIILLTIFSIILASCAQQPAYAEQQQPDPTQTLKLEIGQVNKDQDVNQPSRTPEPTSTLRPSSTPLPSPTPIPSFTTVPSATPIPDSVYLKGVTRDRKSTRLNSSHT